MVKPVQKDKFMPLAFFKKSAFTGSLNGMRYKVEKSEKSEEEVVLVAYVWPEPFSFDHTEQDKITQTEFTFDEAGIDNAVDWINERYQADYGEFSE